MATWIFGQAENRPWPNLHCEFCPYLIGNVSSGRGNTFAPLLFAFCPMYQLVHVLNVSIQNCISLCARCTTLPRRASKLIWNNALALYRTCCCRGREGLWSAMRCRFTLSSVIFDFVNVRKEYSLVYQSFLVHQPPPVLIGQIDGAVWLRIEKLRFRLRTCDHLLIFRKSQQHNATPYNFFSKTSIVAFEREGKL